MPKKIGDITLYTLEELSQKLDVTLVTLRAYLREGKLRGRKIGGRWHVTEESLRAYLSEASEPKPRA